MRYWKIRKFVIILLIPIYIVVASSDVRKPNKLDLAQSGKMRKGCLCFEFIWLKRLPTAFHWYISQRRELVTAC